MKFSEWYILLMSDQPDLTVVRHFGILSHIHIADSTIQLLRTIVRSSTITGLSRTQSAPLAR